MSVILPRSRAMVAVAVLVCGLAIVGALAVHHTGLFVDQGLHEAGVPFVGNNDGYYHLNQARTLAGNGRTVAGVVTDSRQSMLLPYLLSALADDVSSLHFAGAYLGPLLGLTMLLAVLPWAAETRSRFVMFASGLLALLAPYWISRTHVGFLDTDGLVPGLCLFALFSLYRFATGADHRRRWGVVYVLVLALLWFWWRPGAFLSAGFLALYLVYPTRGGLDRALKLVVVGGVVLVAGLATAGIKPFATYVAYAVTHLKLAFGGSSSLLSSAISELRGLSPLELGSETVGSPWLLLPALAGTAVYCLRTRARGLFLVSGWVFGLASFVSQRFIPLFVPVVAFFAAYGAEALCTWLGARLQWRQGRGRALLLAGCLPLLLAGVVMNAATVKPKAYFSKSDFTLARTVRDSLPEDTVLWTWWDYGYFFQYLTGMKTYFDGGSQTEATCFVAAHPLMQPDLDRAARWMHHFSTASWRELDYSKRGSGWSAYVGGFADDLPQATPELPVALVLPSRMYTTAGYLYAFAHVFDAVAPPVSNHLDLFARKGFSYDPAGQSVVVPQVMLDKGYDSFGGVFDATGKSPIGVDFSAIPDPYLVFSDGTDFLAVTDRLVIDSVFFRLLGLFPYDTQRFEPVSFDYRSGGVWRVH